MTNCSRSRLVGALLSSALVCGLIDGAPALADSTALAEFTLATCRPAMDDLAKVDAMARERNWTPDSAPGQFGSVWSVTQDGETFRVATKMERRATLCAVMFSEVKAPRDEFFKTISTAMQLELMGTMTLPQGGGMEIFLIKGDGPPTIFELFTLADGRVIMASIVRKRAE
jgi:hypothetical protein